MTRGGGTLRRGRPLCTRFAPSTAPLHVGAARTALFNWLLARSTGGSFVLRLDDSDDTARASEDALLRDLRWLGLDWDEGPDVGGPAATYRRSEREALYAGYVDALLAAGSAYERDGAVWFRVPPGTTVVHDLVKGDVAFDHDAIADFAVRTTNGTMAHDLVAVVDDATMRIDVVLRGDERLDDTPRELLIARALGFAPPRYAHAGLVVGADRHKLSSANAPVTVDALRRAGFLPDAVIEHLALLGWSAPDGRETFGLAELVTLFSLDRVGHSPSVFDLDRLRAFNARALRALPRARLTELLVDAMQRRRLLEQPVPDAALRWIDTFIDAYGDELRTLGDALDAIAALREEAVTLPALELERLRNRQVLFFLDAVAQYVDAQPELRDLPLGDDLPAIASEFGISRKDAFEAVRMALTGSHDGPPLALLFPLLGHDRIMIRIGAVSSHILHGRGLEPIKYGPGGVPFETIQPTPPDSGATERGGVVS